MLKKLGSKLCSLVLTLGLASTSLSQSSAIWWQDKEKYVSVMPTIFDNKKTESVCDNWKNQQFCSFEECLIHHYENSKFGKKVRKTFPIEDPWFAIDLGAMEVYLANKREKPTFTLTARSDYALGPLKSLMLKYVEMDVEKIEKEYVLNKKEAESVKTFLRACINKPSGKFRFDVRYTLDEPHGALFVYRHFKDKKDEIVCKRLVLPEGAMSLIHFYEMQNFKRHYNATVFSDYYKVTKPKGKWFFERK